MKPDTLQILIDLQKWRTEKVITPAMPNAALITAALDDAIAELEKIEKEDGIGRKMHHLPSFGNIVNHTHKGHFAHNSNTPGDDAIMS